MKGMRSAPRKAKTPPTARLHVVAYLQGSTRVGPVSITTNRVSTVLPQVQAPNSLILGSGQPEVLNQRGRTRQRQDPIFASRSLPLGHSLEDCLLRGCCRGKDHAHHPPAHRFEAPHHSTHRRQGCACCPPKWRASRSTLKRSNQGPFSDIGSTFSKRIFQRHLAWQLRPRQRLRWATGH